MEVAELEAWLALNRVVMRTKGMTPELISELRERLGDAGSAREILDECQGRARGGVLARISTELRAFKQWDAVAKEAAFVESSGISVITINDRNYPARLGSIYSPPILLYAAGKIEAPSGTSIFDERLPAVAVVGTRRASPYGIEMAEAIGRDLAARGIVIVSGMARGCDSAAHRGALDAGGLTIAVVGTGIDTVYPSENGKLCEEIKGSGVVVSEFPMGTAPLPMNFPLRNRIISGLSIAVVVVEAPLRSGAMMTARMALEDGREVFALPGHAGSRTGSGTNKLIKDGAQLVESAEDIIKALTGEETSAGTRKRATKKRRPDPDQLTLITEQTPTPSEDRPVALDGFSLDDVPVKAGTEEASILELLGDGPLHIDGLVERSGIAVQRLSGLLLDMELKGVVAQKPGKLFIKKF